MMGSKMYKRILVLAPHTDDGELGCGASICKFTERGTKVYYAAFSTCEDSVPEGFPANVLEVELRMATSALGIPKENLFVYDYPVRKLSYHRQEVLEELVKLKKEISPDLVMLPSQADQHQDHQTLCAEGLRAFRNNVSVLGYEEPWNHITFSAQAYVRISEQNLEAKLQALSCYRSQNGRAYFSKDFIRSLAVMRGVQIGVPYAEAFEVLRVVL